MTSRVSTSGFVTRPGGRGAGELLGRSGHRVEDDQELLHDAASGSCRKNAASCAYHSGNARCSSRGLDKECLGGHREEFPFVLCGVGIEGQVRVVRIGIAGIRIDRRRELAFDQFQFGNEAVERVVQRCVPCPRVESCVQRRRKRRDAVGIAVQKVDLVGELMDDDGVGTAALG